MRPPTTSRPRGAPRPSLGTVAPDACASGTCAPGRFPSGARAFGVLAFAFTVAAAAAGCADRGGVRVVLQAVAPDGGDLRRLPVHAQVTGPTAGLHYRWFAVAGTCDPQESDTPATVFHFAPAGVRDRVSVEVWRDGRRVTQSDLDVRFDEALARRAAEPGPRVQIEITQVPPFDPDGGPTTRATIGGRVGGQLGRDDHVVLYARADAWYVQPAPAALHAIRADDTWVSWTHTGSRYAALLVRGGYEPPSTLSVLPQVGGDVLAVTAVDGARPQGGSVRHSR